MLLHAAQLRIAIGEKAYLKLRQLQLDKWVQNSTATCNLSGTCYHCFYSKLYLADARC